MFFGSGHHEHLHSSVYVRCPSFRIVHFSVSVDGFYGCEICEATRKLIRRKSSPHFFPAPKIKADNPDFNDKRPKVNYNAVLRYKSIFHEFYCVRVFPTGQLSIKALNFGEIRPENLKTKTVRLRDLPDLFSRNSPSKYSPTFVHL